ncbi:unnamed protein product [Polarella glacialis]|jgi:hypothetical protein|uniref:Uncharacterized protein n=1 Tax=Polarella glacialis TaxID=89957 RepID=A0A813DW40_POLGL|nr:unnamed protein product [Polarella glacialis]
MTRNQTAQQQLYRDDTDDRSAKRHERRHFADCILKHLLDLRDGQNEFRQNVNEIRAMKANIDEMKGMMHSLLAYQFANMCGLQAPSAQTNIFVEKVVEIPKLVEKIVEVPVYKYIEKIIEIPIYKNAEKESVPPICKAEDDQCAMQDHGPSEDEEGSYHEEEEADESSQEQDDEEDGNTFSSSRNSYNQVEPKVERPEAQQETTQHQLCRGQGHVKCGRCYHTERFGRHGACVRECALIGGSWGPSSCIPECQGDVT